MLVQDVKAEDILVDVSPEFHLEKLKQAVTVDVLFYHCTIQMQLVLSTHKCGNKIFVHG